MLPLDLVLLIYFLSNLPNLLAFSSPETLSYSHKNNQHLPRSLEDSSSNGLPHITSSYLTSAFHHQSLLASSRQEADPSSTLTRSFQPRASFLHFHLHSNLKARRLRLNQPRQFFTSDLDHFQPSATQLIGSPTSRLSAGKNTTNTTTKATPAIASTALTRNGTNVVSVTSANTPNNTISAKSIATTSSKASTGPQSSNVSDNNTGKSTNIFSNLYNPTHHLYGLVIAMTVAAGEFFPQFCMAQTFVFPLFVCLFFPDSSALLGLMGIISLVKFICQRPKFANIKDYPNGFPWESRGGEQPRTSPQRRATSQSSKVFMGENKQTSRSNSVEDEGDWREGERKMSYAENVLELNVGSAHHNSLVWNNGRFRRISSSATLTQNSFSQNISAHDSSTQQSFNVDDQLQRILTPLGESYTTSQAAQNSKNGYGYVVL